MVRKRPHVRWLVSVVDVVPYAVISYQFIVMSTRKPIFQTCESIRPLLNIIATYVRHICIFMYDS